MKHPGRHLMIGAITASMAVDCAVSDDVFWTSANGIWRNERAWNDGAGPVPTPEDRAVFAGEGLTTVGLLGEELLEPIAVGRVLVNAGTVRFDFHRLGSSLYALDDSPFLPSLTVGSVQGVAAELVSLQIELPPVGTSFVGQRVRLASNPRSIGIIRWSTSAVPLIADVRIEVGYAGDGLLEVSSATSVRSPHFEIGALSQSFGEVLVAHPDAEVVAENGVVAVGGNGLGVVHVEAGRVETHDLTIARQAGAIGSMAIISGWDSRLMVENVAVIGDFADGMLVIEDGAIAYLLGDAVAGRSGAIDDLSEGTIIVKNWPSELIVDGDLILGFAGQGTLELEDGAEARVGGSVLSVGGDSTLPGRVVYRDPAPGDQPQLLVGGNLERCELVIEFTQPPELEIDNAIELAYVEGEMISNTGVFPDLPAPAFFELQQDGSMLSAVVRTRADVNGDGLVRFEDLLLVLTAWGPCEVGQPCPEDVDLDGEVGFIDAILVLSGWD